MEKNIPLHILFEIITYSHLYIYLQWVWANFNDDETRSYLFGVHENFWPLLMNTSNLFSINPKKAKTNETMKKTVFRLQIKGTLLFS